MVTTVKLDPTVKKEIKENAKKDAKKMVKKLVETQSGRSTGAVQKIPVITKVLTKTSSISQDAENLALAITLPGVGPDVRFPDGITSKRTSTASPFEIVTCSFGGSPSGGTARPLAQNEGMAVVFRNPLRAAVVYDSNVAGLSYSYTYNTPILVPAGIVTWVCQVPYLQSVGAWQPHGNVLYSATVGNGAQPNNPAQPGTFFWADAGSSVTLSVYSSTMTSMTMTLDSYTGTQGFLGNAVTNNVVNFVAAQTQPISISIVQPGYYCPKLNVLGGVTGTQTVQIASISINASNCASFRHLPLKDLTTNASSCRTLRMIGASIMYSNYNTELNLGGQVVGLQSGGEDDWLTYIPAASTSALSAIMSSEDSILMNASLGFYAFLKPMGYSDFDFKDMYETNNISQIVDSSYPLDGNDSYLILATALPTTNLNAAGTYTFRYSIEYTSTDTWRDLDYCYTSRKDADDALEVVKFIAQFHENPVHIKEIGKAIQAGVRWVGDKLKSGIQWTAQNAPAIAKTVLKVGETALQFAPLLV